MTKKTTGKGRGPKAPGAAGPAGQRGKGAYAERGARAARGKPGSAGKPAAWLPQAAARPPRKGDDPAAAAPEGNAPPRKRSPWLPVPQDAMDSAALVDPAAAREAARYAEPIASRELILQVLATADGPLDASQIATRLDLLAAERFDALGKRLAAMLRDGQLLQNRRGAYVPAARVDLVRGTVIANPDGFGFLRADDGGDDLFLPPFEMRKVMHGDRVLASVTGMDRRGRREGAIAEVLERGLTRLLGRFIVEAGIGYVVPDDRRIQRNVLIPPDARGDAREGQLVVCEIVQAPDARRPPLGRVLSVLGERLTASLAVQAAIHGHALPHEFPPEVLAEAAAVPLSVPAAAITGREDLRSLPLVTIDGEDAKDFDDAVWCTPQGNGFRLIVAIADVAHYVRPGSALDVEALNRATSVYFPGFVVPMLPETLSNGICSLNPRVDRLCLACEMQVDASGEITEARFFDAVMHSHARLTYTQVWNAIGDGVEAEVQAEAQAQVGARLSELRHLHRLYRVLARARHKRGAIEFESGEVRFVLDQRGEVVQGGMLQRNDAHRLIEECMIAANVAAARLLEALRIPALFRVHAPPPEQKYADLLEFLKEFGLRMPPWNKVVPGDFARLIERVRERPDAALLESVLLRSQSLALYSPENGGHFGLALAAYAHFTSPIRRYPDLLVHRAIKHAVHATAHAYSASQMSSLALQCSERERRADEAEREVDERYRAAWMEQHVGGTFEGTVSGVTSFGLFVELDESKVNGLIHVTQLPYDFYHFDPLRKTLSGERRGRVFRLGDRLSIVVLKASLEERKIDFRLAEDERGPRQPPPRGTPAKRRKQPY